QKQAAILTAEGAKQAAILTAEAERQSRILRAQGDRAARYLQAQGQAKAIEKVFAAIKAGRPTPELLAYQYLQTLPQMAQGDANKVWIVPSDFNKALEGFTKMLGAPGEDGVFRYEPSPEPAPASRPEEDEEAVSGWFDTSTDPHIAELVRAAEEVARREVPGPEVGMARALSAPIRPVLSGQPGAEQPMAEPVERPEESSRPVQEPQTPHAGPTDPTRS
ncbi:MAG: SPFH domain-containing protein, partial [Pseudonocardiaceae bacterium]